MNISSKKTNQQNEQIVCSVCIATFKRPKLLKKLIRSLFEQKEIDDIKLEIIIIDNDIEKSAKEIVDEFSARTSIAISYYEQPVQNISLTRNKALDKSSGHYIAIIDDDETADEFWIRNLIDALVRYNADAVFGYVIPIFPLNIPDWLQQREIYFLPMGKTGDFPLGFYTTNCIIRANHIRENNLRFDPEYGLTGGEDRVFFDMLLYEHNFKFVVCREALTYEIIPTHRAKLKFIFHRFVQKGNNYARIITNSKSRKCQHKVSFLVVKSLLGIAYYSLLLLILLPLKRKWIFSVIGLALNIGKLSALFKLKFFIYKTENSNL